MAIVFVIVIILVVVAFVFDGPGNLDAVIKCRVLAGKVSPSCVEDGTK